MSTFSFRDIISNTAHLRNIALLFFASVSIVSCANTPAPTIQTGTLQASEADLITLPPPGSLDSMFLEISEQIPEFGGLYKEKDRIKMVVAIEANELSASSQNDLRVKYLPILTDALGEEFFERHSYYDRETKLKIDFNSESIDVISGEFSFNELSAWKSTARNLLAYESIHSIDADERANRVRIGVMPNTNIDLVLRAAKELDLPPEALLIETEEPIYFNNTLRSRMRPPRGGVQIEIDTALFGYKTCTYGFNVRRYGEYGFITNSHCTKTRGVTQDDDVHQPNDPIFTFNTKIGDEKADPPFLTGGNCPSGRKCRFSDSAFIKLNTSVGQGLVKTTGWNTGSLDISENPFVLPIEREQSAWLYGTEIDKIGRTTGWTYGTINQTCYDKDVADTDITLFCQNNVIRGASATHNMSDKGDSGSPVFFWQGDSAVLAGILWGSLPDGTNFAYSPLNLIESELGPLTTHSFFRPPPSSTGCNDRCCKYELFQGKPICTKCISTGQFCFADEPPVLNEIFAPAPE